MGEKTKQCNQCGEIKGFGDYFKDKRLSDGLYSVCKPCHNKRQLESRKNSIRKPCTLCGQAPRENNQVLCKPCGVAKTTASKYGVTIEEAKELRAKTRCDACGRTEEEVGIKKALSVDHCHANGHVRGVLCHYCNVSLGMLLDDPVRIMQLHGYLNRCNYDESNTL